MCTDVRISKMLQMFPMYPAHTAVMWVFLCTGICNKEWNCFFLIVHVRGSLHSCKFPELQFPYIVHCVSRHSGPNSPWALCAPHTLHPWMICHCIWAIWSAITVDTRFASYSNLPVYTVSVQCTVTQPSEKVKEILWGMTVCFKPQKTSMGKHKERTIVYLITVSSFY